MQYWEITWKDGTTSFIKGNDSHNAVKAAGLDHNEMAMSSPAKMEDAAEALYTKFYENSLARSVVSYEMSSERQKDYWRGLVKLVHETIWA